MKYENLWSLPDADECLNTTENIYEIMKEQSNYLKENTNQKVLAKFSKIKTSSPLYNLGQIIKPFSATKVIENSETENLIDVTDMYRTKKYCFEIYNSTYKFRVFEMTIPPIFPIDIIIDEGIVSSDENLLLTYAEKGNDKNSFTINSEHALLKILQIIFSSKKIKLIILNMKNQDDKTQ